MRRTNGDLHMAEDVAQAVFAKLAKEAVALERHEVLAGWLYVDTLHAAANAMRTEQRRKIREQEAVTMSETPAQALSGAEWERLRPELDAVMDELNESDRNAVLLRFFENRHFAEIGASFRISEDAARMRVDRALEKLRTLLARRGVTSTAAALGGLLAAQSAVAAPAGLASAVTGSVLAGAGGVVATIGNAGLIAFMTTNKFMLCIAAGAILLGGSTALFEAREAQRTAGDLAALSLKHAALQARLATQDAELLRLEKELVAVKNIAAPVTAAGSQKTKAMSSAPVKTAAVNSRQALYANPEYVALEMRLTETGAKLQYGPLYHRLHWSPERIKEFERLIVERQQNSFDVLSAASENGLDAQSPALKKEWDDQVFAENQSKMKALLGKEDYAAYIGYKPWSAVGMLETLAGNLYYSDNPLTAVQGEELAAVIQRHTTMSADKVTFDWPAIYAEAGNGVLSAGQLDTFKAANDRNDLFLQKNALEQKIREGATVPKN